MQIEPSRRPRTDLGCATASSVTLRVRPHVYPAEDERSGKALLTKRAGRGEVLGWKGLRASSCVMRCMQRTDSSRPGMEQSGGESLQCRASSSLFEKGQSRDRIAPQNDVCTVIHTVQRQQQPRCPGCSGQSGGNELQNRRTVWRNGWRWLNNNINTARDNSNTILEPRGLDRTIYCSGHRHGEDLSALGDFASQQPRTGHIPRSFAEHYYPLALTLKVMPS
jgi:hypothetical protein